MRKLSLWGKNNPGFARIIIITIHLLLLWIASGFANQFSAAGIQLSVWWTYFFISLFIIAALLYPSKTKRKKSKWNYIKHKSCDLAVGICGFCLMCCFFNRLNNGSFNQSANAYTGVNHSLYKNPEAEKLLKAFKDGEKKFFTRKEKRIIKTEFRYQVKQYVKAGITGNKDGTADALLIILSCIAAVGLLLIVGALACGLACDGSEGLAVLVAILGTVGVIWGLVVVIKLISRKHKKSPPSAEGTKQ